MYACTNDITYLIHSRSIILSTWDFPLENATAQRLQSWKSTTITMNLKQVTFANQNVMQLTAYLFAERALATFVACRRQSS